jgi:transcription antitermination protein NusB
VLPFLMVFTIHSQPLNKVLLRMISRRNIRVKVMQLLYVMETAGDQKIFKDPIVELQKQLDNTKELLVYLLYFLTETARYAESDSRNRSNRNLPSASDLNVNVKIAGNELLWQIMENKSFVKLVEEIKPQLRIDKDLVKKIYNLLADTDEYKTYINQLGRDKAKEKAIMEFIFNNIMLQNELLDSQVEELFSNWDDDGEMTQQLINNFLAKPNQDLAQLITSEKWQFAKTLLTTTIDKKDYALELIKPKLNNWDAERIAVLDMLLMQMGVCEMLYFETIPVKVTINEYIDLAKDYSTPQSGQFVNGILDNLNKEFMAGGKIHKVDFKPRR